MIEKRVLIRVFSFIRVSYYPGYIVILPYARPTTSDVQASLRIQDRHWTVIPRFQAAGLATESVYAERTRRGRFLYSRLSDRSRRPVID